MYKVAISNDTLKTLLYTAVCNNRNCTIYSNTM